MDQLPGFLPVCPGSVPVLPGSSKSKLPKFRTHESGSPLPMPFPASRGLSRRGTASREPMPLVERCFWHTHTHKKCFFRSAYTKRSNRLNLPYTPLFWRLMLSPMRQPCYMATGYQTERGWEGIWYYRRISNPLLPYFFTQQCIHFAPW